jgi:hypothetical protein
MKADQAQAIFKFARWILHNGLTHKVVRRIIDVP